MLKLAVVGKDVSKSQSPAMHAFILGAMGERCTYDTVSIPPEQFAARAESLFETYDAFNVTIPFKGEIIPFLKELKGDARSFGAVNTVVSATRTGYNTDGYGFLLMLENAGIAVSGKKVLVLGAGGAGRSCIKKLVETRAGVFVYDKSFERLQTVKREVGGFTPLSEIEMIPFDIIVNCTGVGMHDTVGKSPVGSDLLSLCSAAVDLIYEPQESEFLRLARTLQKRTLNGAAMLFYQAYRSDCIYLGREPSAAQAKELWNTYREKNI